MLCANKTDLRDEYLSQGKRVIPKESGEAMAKDHQAIFCETSIKEGQNVIEALMQLARFFLFRVRSLNYQNIIFFAFQGHHLKRSTRFQRHCSAPGKGKRQEEILLWNVLKNPKSVF